jgi:hypothetical protein
MKSGQTIYINNKPYLFLGYVDYKRTIWFVADMNGNTFTYKN